MRISSSEPPIMLAAMALVLSLVVACGEPRSEVAAAAPADDPDQPTVPLPHLGQGASVWASSTHLGGPGEGPASHLVDGDPATRWTSEDADDQEITIDLKAVKRIARLHLMWGRAAARIYTVQVSANGSTWSVPISTTSGVPGPRIDDIPVSADVRFLRIGLKQRSRPGGFSLDEIVILGR
jgi:hypothetical protein